MRWNAATILFPSSIAPSLIGRSPANFPQFCKRGVFAQEGPRVHTPGFRLRINFAWLNKSVADVKTFPASNADYLVGDARIGGAHPPLLVYRSVAFADDLSVLEPVMPERHWHG